MDPRTPSEIDATGTLPLTGEGSVPLTEESPEAAASARPEWVEEARAGLTVPGKYLAYEDSGRRIVAPVSREWTRIGRSLSADVRFDDATVSRRHALVVSQAEGVRVLDDRSLNGIYVNGQRVDWAPLTDGDEIAIGRHTIHFFDTATVGSGSPPAPAAVGE
jgi:pSer/pThr/pTyr-binding forkhead associated (FHA) protein